MLCGTQARMWDGLRDGLSSEEYGFMYNMICTNIYHSPT